MTNIWGFLMQTLTASLTAALLLAVKELLADKLSPRWQYGIWGVLALRILLPVSLSRRVLLPVPLWVETWKGAAERHLHSAYTGEYVPTILRGPFPWAEGAPQSVTDWLFAGYAAGAAAALLWYLAAYLRLRRLLRRGSPVSERARARIQALCTAYSLGSCRAVAVPGLPSAFVCGVVRPVLALPAGQETDDKVLLHELLHLKHRDALQSAGWCVLRALHWCNPFLQWIFDLIGNDMEALCDQRVLERLEGEARRDYGRILLSMANDRYPRAPGTTSVSNGGKNIARRITAIARFQKYPRGMGLVSVCVAVVLAVPVLAGTAAGYPGKDYRPDSGWKLERAMALARVQRCTTVAGALDTYAKGLMEENGVYIAMASSPEQHGALEERMRAGAETGGRALYRLDSGPELEMLAWDDGYSVQNLDRKADGSYTALLVFSVGEIWRPDGGDRTWSGSGHGGSVTVPVTVRRENDWVVAETGPRRSFEGLSLSQVLSPDADLPWLRYDEAAGETGTVSIGVSTSYRVDNTAERSEWSPFGGTVFDGTVKPDAAFDSCQRHVYVRYVFGGNSEQRGGLSSVAMEAAPLTASGEAPVFSGRAQGGDSSWSSSRGTAGSSQTVTPDWDGILESGGGGTAELKNGLAELPAGYAVRVWWNGRTAEDFVLGEAER